MSRQSRQSSISGRVIGVSRLAPPTASSRTYFRWRIACSGFIQGPPLMAHPGQVCRLKRSPNRWASEAVNFTRSSHFGERHSMCSSVPGQSAGFPIWPWKSCMPWMPEAAMASRSRRMPSRRMLPLMKWNHVSGKKMRSGCRNAFSSARPNGRWSRDESGTAGRADGFSTRAPDFLDGTAEYPAIVYVKNTRTMKTFFIFGQQLISG